MVSVIRPYDIDLIPLFSLIREQLIASKRKSSDKGKYLAQVKKNMLFYCEIEGLDFQRLLDRKGHIIVRQGHALYHTFLSMQLAHIDLPKMHFFLDYHFKRFRGNQYMPYGTFVECIQHGIYDEVKKAFPNNMDARLAKMIEWANINRHRRMPETRLLWVGSPEALKTMSRRLYHLKYMVKPTDFEKLFTENQPAAWLKSTQELAYLIYCLKTKGLIKSTPHRGYLRHAEYLFSDHCSSRLNKNGLKDVLDRMRGKHPKLKDSIDSMVDPLLS